MNILRLIPLFLLAQVSQAGILGNSYFIEPQLGYKTESTKLTDLSNTTIQIKSALPVVGLRLGYRSISGVELNLAGEMSSGNAEVSGQTEKNKFSHKVSAVQLGVNSFGLIKMYLGFSLSNQWTLEDSVGLPGYTLSGPAYHAGLQLRAFSWLQLGLQYNLNRYNSVTGSSYTAGPDIETYFNKVDAQDYSVYLSTSF